MSKMPLTHSLDTTYLKESQEKSLKDYSTTKVSYASSTSSH